MEVKQRIEKGLLKNKRFDLEALARREVTYSKPFVCKGGAEKCDRRCEIAMIELEGARYPFGGACNRYYNLRQNIRHDVQNLDLVRLRQHLVFEKYGAGPVSPSDTSKKGSRKRIGINRSFLVNTYYPLYSTFFRELGLEPVMPETYSQEGIDQKNAAFCYPGELAHGYFHSLLEMENPPEYIFLPHFKAVPVLDGSSSSQVCPFVQGETFYLKATFREKLSKLQAQGTRVLTPLLDLTEGLATARKPLVDIAVQMVFKRKTAVLAFATALNQHTACLSELRAIGKKTI